MSDRDAFNGARFVQGDPGGHYESWFMRANHPERAEAFWIRYTIFSPKNRAGNAVGELWAIWFDGDAEKVTAVKEVVPIDRCRFGKSELDVTIGDSVLGGDGLTGAAEAVGHRLAWKLGYTSPKPPLLFLPRDLYAGGFPKAKAMVGSPHAVFSGEVTVDDEVKSIDGWVGSQNHNWGSKHTDEYAWGQVAGFDGEPDAFLELITARIKLGPVRSPWMTIIVLRLDGEEHRLNTIPQALKARGRYDFFTWSFSSRTPDVEVRGSIAAPRSFFVGLPYDNPPGGRKTCLNTKIARCDLSVRRRGRPPVSLSTKSRAAFEILTDATDHHVPVLGT